MYLMGLMMLCVWVCVCLYYDTTLWRGALLLYTLCHLQNTHNWATRRRPAAGLCGYTSTCYTYKKYGVNELRCDLYAVLHTTQHILCITMHTVLCAVRFPIDPTNREEKKTTTLMQHCQRFQISLSVMNLSVFAFVHITFAFLHFFASHTQNCSCSHNF